MIWFRHKSSSIRNEIKSSFHPPSCFLRESENLNLGGSQSTGEKHQSLKRCILATLKIISILFVKRAERNLILFFHKDAHMPPKKRKGRKKHKLECFVWRKQFFPPHHHHHHRNNFLQTRALFPSIAKGNKNTKRFCFESKQAASMKMVISHHFSSRWKTFMLRIIMWWKECFSLSSFDFPSFFVLFCFRFVLHGVELGWRKYLFA